MATGSSTRIVFSSAKTGLGLFQQVGEVFRKDFMRVGEWVARTLGGKPIKISVTKERIARWERTFAAFRKRGISVPLTVDHIQVTDENGKPVLRKLTPGMAEAKRGEVVNLFAQGDRGMCEVTPADEEAKTLMNRCPEVSFELEKDFVDQYGNYYPEAVTAITLTPVPMLPGQQMVWEKVAGGDPLKIAASRDPRDKDREIICMSAEPLLESETHSESHMSPTHLERLRKAMAMPSDPEEEVHAKAVSHIEGCYGKGYMSREDADKLVASARKEGEDKILVMSRQLEEAKAGTRLLTVEDLAKDADEDALEMAAGGIEARVKALAGRYTPTQIKLVMSKLVGETGKRNVIACSRKTATKVGLPDTLANMVLEILEAGDPAEMKKMLEEQSKAQNIKIVASRNPNQDVSQFDEGVMKRMIESANASVPGTGFVM